MELNWFILLVPPLIAINAFFVASEYVVVAIRPAQVQLLRQQRRQRTASAIEALKANPASSLGTIQVCITMANLLLGWIGEPAMSALLLFLFSPLVGLAPLILTSIAFILSFVLVTLLTVVFSELLPKALTLRFIPTVALVTAVPVQVLRRLLSPLVRIMKGLANLVTRPLGLGDVDALEQQGITVDELRLMTAEAAAGGQLTSRERSLVLNALTIGRRSARQIMVPRIHVSHLDLQWSMDKNREVMNRYLHSRLPLCNGGLDHLVGVVHTKEFLSAYYAEGDSQVLGLIARPAVFVPENISLDKLLTLFHEHRSEMVFLVNEYGGFEGIVTLQDVVDELIGQIVEAQSPHPPSVPVSAPPTPGQNLQVPGDMPIPELARHIDRGDWGASSSMATVGGLIIAELAHLPAVGEEVDVEGVHLRVLETDGRAIRRVEVLPPTRPAA